MPSNGSPAMNTRGPGRRPDSNASRCSMPAYGLTAGILSDVIPYASQMRPNRDP